jgi:hypothetical protein
LKGEPKWELLVSAGEAHGENVDARDLLVRREKPGPRGCGAKQAKKEDPDRPVGLG